MAVVRQILQQLITSSPIVGPSKYLSEFDEGTPPNAVLALESAVTGDARSGRAE